MARRFFNLHMPKVKTQQLARLKLAEVKTAFACI